MYHSRCKERKKHNYEQVIYAHRAEGRIVTALIPPRIARLEIAVPVGWALNTNN